ncbi:NAD-dependent epimerase/dehydratase family protein [Mangrovimicrobium sediminis]|uniref:NAD-dependent epimerase/dehydratase family protein n=1 Tax=Mangrovimicrobium sediminis TaxID=2562682 RepID=A0A4Z0LXD8_9GAMM|nr:carboxylic acid reductase [Haliea sp. SAOS-164]TGD71826.1 NAD-dependent epimerase/dehydratase family protein [Haliea sp. SAOS-164]
MSTAQKRDPLQGNQGADAEREKQAQRFLQLHAEDAQFRDAMALEAVNEAKRQPGLRLAEVVKIVMEGYAERPALGQRAREIVTDPASGRSTIRLLPRFETVSYAQLWRRACTLAAEWHSDADAPLRAGDFLAILGFASVDYATNILAGIHLGATLVPLQTSAPASNHAAILAETETHTLACGIDYLDKAVEAVLAGHAPKRLVVFDVEPRDDAQRERLDVARAQLQAADCPIRVDTLETLVERGATLPAAPLYVPPEEEDPLAWLFYTSGTTGTPKGAMFPQSLVINTWLLEMPLPAITLSFMPMSHLVGNGFMLMSLGCGGTSFCSPKSDLSTLFEDLSLVRPTMVSLVPRVCEMLYQHFLREVDRRVAAGEDAAAVEDAVKREMREQLLGGRLFSAGTGSAALAPEIYAFMKSMLDMHMPIGYASTEIGGGTVLVDGKIQRPLVIDYKLEDVPELGYFTTDKPYPRGELLVKTSQFMGGYFKRPELTAERLDAEGFYRTGDVMAELGPDHLQFVDRSNNVIKLSQGEFVAVARLEALYSQSPLVHQIYIYGTSERAFLLAVVVPAVELLGRYSRGGADAEQVKAEIRQSLQAIAEHNGLNGYELPRDFIIETEAFSQKNGLLSEIGKHLRPMLRARYGDTLEDLYAEMAQGQVEELRALRTGGADQPVLETVLRALKVCLGAAALDVQPEDRFGDLGGDSLTALEFAILLEEIFDVEVPVGTIINPAGSARLVAETIERARNSNRATFANVHGKGATRVKASDLTLDKFIDPDTLTNATGLPPAGDASGTVLLTGATGFLGRFLAIAWLEQLAKTGGRLVLIARGADAQDARRRVESALATDPALLEHFRELAWDHLEVVAGDLAAPDLGLDADNLQSLAERVDVIVHCGAHVNHVLPYKQLFAANVAGTADLVRLAITGKRKRIHYISTLGVSTVCKSGLVDETSDIREAAPECELREDYANGYGVSKWASEVLLREAHDDFGLPVCVFRPGMILAHSQYGGQLNVPDMFTRLLYSLAVTGVAPATFYAQELADGERPGARYEGFTVDFLAAATTAIGLRVTSDFHAYNEAGAGTGNVSLDDFVDWLVDAGCAITRVPRYDEWLAHFETAMQALPEEQRRQSLLALLAPYRQPQHPGVESVLPSGEFRAAVEASGLAMPQLSRALIDKYVADLRQLALL